MKRRTFTTVLPDFRCAGSLNTGNLEGDLQRASDPGDLQLEEGDGGLPKQSVVVGAQLSSAEKARLGERIGSLSQESAN